MSLEYILDGETTKPETESTYEIENPDSNWRVGFIELEVYINDLIWQSNVVRCYV